MTEAHRTTDQNHGTQPPQDATRAEAARVDRINALRLSIAKKLDEIAMLYKDDVKVTLIVRVPDFPDGRRDTVLSDDDPEKAIDSLRRLYGDPNSERYANGG